MAVTLTDIDTFHDDRGNAAWADLDDRNAALLKALDYEEMAYAPLKAGAKDEPRYLIALATLALQLAQNPQSGVAAPLVKKEAKEGAGFKKEVEYFEATEADPFPNVTALYAPLKVGVTVPSVSFGRMVR